VRITTNDPKHANETLRATGTVLVPLKRSPRAVNFRQLQHSETPAPITVALERGDGAPLNLEIDSPTKPGLVLDLREIEAGERYELDVGVLPPQRQGRFYINLTVKTGVPEAPEISIPVYASVPANWS
jgi:hypothetical protein